MKPEQVEGHRAAYCDQFGHCESGAYAGVMERVGNERVSFRQANRQPQIGQDRVEDLRDEKEDDDEIAEPDPVRRQRRACGFGER